MESIIVGSLAAALMPVFFWGYAQVVPRPQKLSAEGEIDPASRKEFAAWEAFSIVPLVVFTALFGFAFYLAFVGLQRWAAPQAAPGEIVVCLPNFAYIVPAFMLGLCASAVPANFNYSKLLGSRYADYLRNGNARHGFDGMLVFWGMAGIIIAVTVVLAPLAMRCYFRFDDRALYSNGFLAVQETEHRYADLRELRWVRRVRAPNGNVNVRPHFQLVFKDGYTWQWSSVFEPNERQGEEAKAALFDFIRKHSGQTVVEYDLAPE